MPKLNNATMEQNALVTNSYGYSAVKPDDLDGTEYTLVDIEVDISSSVSGFSNELENTIKTVIEACKKSPRSDSLLVRINTFASALSEIHGFKDLVTCNPSDYDNTINPYGMTSLYDASENGISSILAYSAALNNKRIRTNGIVFVITDGCDVCSKLTAKYVKEAKNAAIQGEHLESLLTILVGVNVGNSQVASSLSAFKTDGGFDQYETTSADASGFAKLANFVSRSISSQSQHIGTGGGSQTLAF